MSSGEENINVIPTNAGVMELDQQLNEVEREDRVSEQDKSKRAKSKRKKDPLQRGMGRVGQKRESQVLKSLGMDTLTSLGRIGSVRVEVSNFHLDKEAALESLTEDAIHNR